MDQSSSGNEAVQSATQFVSYCRYVTIFNFNSIFSNRQVKLNSRPMATKNREEPARQRYQANARERDRTHRWATFQETKSSLCSVNTAYSALRTLIPTEPADRKLSKIETLRLASSYISHLDAVLFAGPVDHPCLEFEERSSAAYRQNSDDHWPEARQQPRPQVCTFCLAMHKKCNLNYASHIILPDCEKNNGTTYVPTNGTSYFDVNAI